MEREKKKCLMTWNRGQVEKSNHLSLQTQMKLKQVLLGSVRGQEAKGTKAVVDGDNDNTTHLRQNRAIIRIATTDTLISPKPMWCVIQRKKKNEVKKMKSKSARYPYLHERAPSGKHVNGPLCRPCRRKDTQRKAVLADRVGAHEGGKHTSLDAAPARKVKINIIYSDSILCP